MDKLINLIDQISKHDHNDNKSNLVKELETIDLNDLGQHVPELEFRGYFLGKPSQEHYMLLAYFSSIYQSATLLDIGTYKGCSSLALAYNPLNSVVSFDLTNIRRNLSYYPKNITYIVDNIISDTYKELVLNSSFILLDTDHDGVFEREFHTYLQKLNWKGILMLDDIKLNNEMNSYWNWIPEEKYDVSNIGHWSGTGIVKFI